MERRKELREGDGDVFTWACSRCLAEKPATAYKARWPNELLENVIAKGHWRVCSACNLTARSKAGGDTPKRRRGQSTCSDCKLKKDADEFPWACDDTTEVRRDDIRR